MSKVNFEKVEIVHTVLTVDVSLIGSESLYFNATEMAKGFGRLPADYLRLDTTERYVAALKSRYGISHNALVKKKRGGKYQGTWLHKKLALDFARWLSPDFAVVLDEWAEQRLKKEKTRKQARLAARTGYLPMSEAVLEAHDPIKFYHFSNEANLINRIVLGMTAKAYREKHSVDSVRDSVEPEQIKWIEKLQRINTGLIELGMPFDMRKKMLQERYDNNLKLVA